MYLQNYMWAFCNQPYFVCILQCFKSKCYVPFVLQMDKRRTFWNDNHYMKASTFTVNNQTECTVYYTTRVNVPFQLNIDGIKSIITMDKYARTQYRELK